MPTGHICDLKGRGLTVGDRKRNRGADEKTVEGVQGCRSCSPWGAEVGACSGPPWHHPQKSESLRGRGGFATGAAWAAAPVAAQQREEQGVGRGIGPYGPAPAQRHRQPLT
jgi:hypothetical protein